MLNMNAVQPASMAKWLIRSYCASPKTPGGKFWVTATVQLQSHVATTCGGDAVWVVCFWLVCNSAYVCVVFRRAYYMAAIKWGADYNHRSV